MPLGIPNLVSSPPGAEGGGQGWGELGVVSLDGG